MPEYTIETAIAPGHNNAAGLALITSLSASSIPFLDVETAGRYRRGLARVMLGGVTKRMGYASCEWVSRLLWLPQYEFLRTTYEGAVTIRTWTNSTTYLNFNAILTLDDPAEYSPVNTVQYGWALTDFVWRFTMLQGL